MDNTFTPEPQNSTADSFRFLQTGDNSLDQLLRDCRVPQGGTIYLDCAFLYWASELFQALSKGAVLRGERVVFVYAPTMRLMFEEEDIAATRAGNKLELSFEAGLEGFGLAPYFNKENFADPNAPLRHLVANTFQEFEDTINHLLTEPAGAPDQIFIYGLDQLYYMDVPLSYQWELQCENEFAKVQTEFERLRGFLQEVTPRLENAGTALWLSRSAESYAFAAETGASTLFTRGLGPLLQANCDHTLLIEKLLTEVRNPRPMHEVIGGVPVTLFAHDRLLGEEIAVVLYDKYEGSGPFLDSESNLAAILDALG